MSDMSSPGFAGGGAGGGTQLHLQALQGIVRSVNALNATLQPNGAPLSVRGNPTNAVAHVADIAGTKSQILQVNKTATAVGFFSALDDESSVIGVGNAASYYNPTYFNNAASGIVHRLNRVMVGGAVVGSSDRVAIVGQSIPDYVQALAGGGDYSDAQLSVLSTVGGTGVFGANRSSDYHTWSGGHTGGSGAIFGLGINDDGTGGNPIALGGLFLGYCRSNVTSGLTLAAQFDMNNNGPLVDITPNTGIGAGACVSIDLTAGANTTWATVNVSAAAFIGPGGTQRFRKGIVFASNGLDTSVGGGTGGLAIEMARNQSIRWLNSTPTTDAELWANASGIVLNTYPILQTSAPGAATAYNAVIDSAGNQAVICGGGGSSPDHSTYYRNTSHNFADIGGANFSHFLNSAGAYINSSLAIAAGGSTGIGIRLSSTVNFGIFYGSGAPTLSAAQGSLYLRSDGSNGTTRAYINTNGSTTWTAINTVA